MNPGLYKEFRAHADRGDRRRAEQSVTRFIDSFEDDTERRAWVREFLESGDYGHKIRHELYRELIFPELHRGYQADDPWSLYFLARTIQNVYDFHEFSERLGMATDYSLLQDCFRIAPDFRDVRAQLLDSVCRSINFAIHEWPAGLCCELEELQSELRFARTLDSENIRSTMFEEVERILAEARARESKP